MDMKQTAVWEETITIPTYEAGRPDKNPMFLEKRVYQGSSGRVYPHPVTETLSDVKTDKKYRAVFLENDYLKVMVLPEIGGRIQRIYDKTNGYDCVYYNEVIKPALVGLAGPWISGGIEFNWPQHHRPSTFDPVSCTFRRNADGSATVIVGETEKMTHTHSAAAFTLYPDKAYVEIKAHLYNPTSLPKTFLWWANPAVEVNDNTQSVFPPDVHAVMDHGKRDVSKFPIADGVYYKVDYAPGTDISRYKNIPVPTSYMAYHSDFDFVGNYDHGKNAGLLHVADHHISPGKKQWTWGCGDFGRSWDRNLSDDGRPYIELMTGVFTDNQPDFTFLAPYESKSFTQYFMPYKNAGAVKNANEDAMVNLESENGRIRLRVYTSGEFSGSVLLSQGDKVLVNEQVSLSPLHTYDREIEGENDGLYFALIDGDGSIVLEYAPQEEAEEETPAPAQASPLPEDIETIEELYLTAVHLEQYRHATYDPDDYYREGLRRDAGDIRLNNGYGKRLYARGLYEEAEEHFRRAVKRSTMKNPNPYDSEPYYNLGLALEAQGKLSEAFDSYYKATWSDAMKSRAYLRMAFIEARRENFARALEFVEESLVFGGRNLSSRDLKTALLRLAGDTKTAAALAHDTVKLDAVDTAAYWELYRLGEISLSEFSSITHGDAFNYVETALFYKDAGLTDEAVTLLKQMQDSEDPLIHYYLAYLTGDEGELFHAAELCPDCCFPNRLEDIPVLQYAAERNKEDNKAPYYLGNILYDKGRFEEAIELWEESRFRNDRFATVRRNLALSYFNKRHDAEAAERELSAAVSLDPEDMRVFFEYDQLLKQLNRPVSERLAHMEERKGLLEKRDDLYTEYITLLNRDGQYEKALKLMRSHKFHPWEGGEGKITKEYKTSLVQLAKTADNPEELLTAALSYPENLGEGKLIGEKDNDVYYYLGCLDTPRAAEYLEKAADCAFELGGAMYYNDQPPHMLYYAALALRRLGREDEALLRLKAMAEYGRAHMNDHMRIDYFAVSLPDFLIFEADLDRKNRAECCRLAALGYMGLGDEEEAGKYLAEMEKADCSLMRIF